MIAEPDRWWAQSREDVLAEGIRLASEELEAGARVTPMVEYQERPIDYAVEVLGIERRSLVWSENPGYENHEWDGTPDPIVAMAEALVGWEDVGVESATGTGKSHGLAWLSLWFSSVWDGSRIFSYAAKEDQLELYMWREIAKLWRRFKRRFPHADLRSLHYRMDGKVRDGDAAGWEAVGRSVGVGADEEVATKAAGMHAEHMLIIGEEVPGISHAVTAAHENTCTGPHNLRLYVGNPDSEDDALHQFCIQEGVRHVRISALDHPNVVVNVARDPEWRDVENDTLIVPGAVSRKSVQRRLRRYGREGRLYLSRVRGISPKEAPDALIRQVWIDRAVELWKTRELRHGLRALGVDVANSEDGDKGAIADGVGAHLDHVDSFPCPNASDLGLRVAALAAMGDVSEQHIGVDTGGGWGASTTNKLKECGLHVRGLNGGEKAQPIVDEDLVREKSKSVRQEEVFRNLRAQTWWQLAIDLQHGRVAVPPDEELHADLKAVRWKSKLGRIWIEEKDEIRKRIGRSPDKGDAVVNWNWVRHRRAIKEEEAPRSAWDPDVLAHEAREGRRVRERPAARPRSQNPATTEWIP